jgi:hypothetical protein
MADLSCALADLGLPLADLQRTAEQIVLFGSRAVGLGRAGSDWDLLVVGEGRSRHTPSIDLVWVSPRELVSRSWLASELASHVARWIEPHQGWCGHSQGRDAALATGGSAAPWLRGMRTDLPERAVRGGKSHAANPTGSG